METLDAALRKGTVAQKLCPLLMGSAYKNKGVQPLLDAVVKYLPAPTEVVNSALPVVQEAPGAMTTVDQGEKSLIELKSCPNEPFVGLAFKLEQGRFGQLTYIRVYRGTLRRGDVMVNTSTGEKIKAPRLVRMHSNEMEDIQEVSAGDIAALFGVDCKSGDTFCAEKSDPVSMESMFVPEPVISLAISSKAKNDANFGKALLRFSKEDPTFRVTTDEESKETIISGMGELHLQIYVERMKREYGIECEVGAPVSIARASVGGVLDRANYLDFFFLIWGPPRCL